MCAAGPTFSLPEPYRGARREGLSEASDSIRVGLASRRRLQNCDATNQLKPEQSVHTQSLENGPKINVADPATSNQQKEQHSQQLAREQIRTRQ